MHSDNTVQFTSALVVVVVVVVVVIVVLAEYTSVGKILHENQNAEVVRTTFPAYRRKLSMKRLPRNTV